MLAVGTEMTERAGRTEVRRQPPIDGNEDGREAAVAVLAAHIAELEEAKRDGANDRLADVSGDGVEVEVGEATWEVWLGEDGWTASRPTYGSEITGEGMGFGEGDLIGTVDPATLSAEEIVRRLVTLEFDDFQEN
jgi:hypothetical protein